MKITLLFNLKTPINRLYKSLLLPLLFLLIGGNAWGQSTAIYTIGGTASSPTVTPSGTRPSGSGATYTQSYTGAISQMTGGNNSVFKLTGYAGKKITSIVLEMHSNSSAGSGTLSVVAGTTTIASVSPAAAFNTSSWYNNWSSSYVNVTKTPTAYTIQSGEDVTITIAATVNSLFIDKYTITYDTPAVDPADRIAFTTTATSPTVNVAATYAVSAQNASSQTDTNYTSNITLSKVSGPGTVGGTLTKAAVAGVATFSDITFSAAGTYVLKASSSTLGDATSSNIVVTTAVIYNKITSLAALTDGDYIIVANGTKAMNNDNTTTANKLGVTTVTVSSNQITNPPASVVWTIATSGSNKTIYNAAAGTYVSGGGSNTNLTLSSTASTTSQQWTPSYNTASTNLFRFLNVAQNTRGLVLSDPSPFGQYAISNVDNSTYYDVALYKKSVATFTVTFDANGGTGTMAAQTASTTTALTTNAFTRTGYTFTGWNTAANGSGTAYTNGGNYDFTADVTLYAQWSINSYTVTYNGNSNTGGTAPTQQNGNYNTTVTLANNTGSLVRTGYTFQGWNTAANGSGTHYNVGASFTIPASNTTLYAEWLTNSPTLTPTGTLTAMSTTYGTVSSPEQNFGVTGANLTGSNVTVTPPAGFEVSTVSGGTFASTVNLPISSQSVSGTVYIRLAKTTAVGTTYGGNVTLSDGTTNATINVPNSTVLAKALTITGLSASDKTYDGNTTVSVTGTPAYNGLENGETFSVTGSVTWAFGDKNYGINKSLTRTGSYAAPSSNYTVTQPSLTATINKKNITITSITANDKTYDGTVTATFTGVASTDIVSGDTVSYSVTGNFDDANAGSGKTVTVLSITLSGTDKDNYSVPSLPSGLTAKINKAGQTITFNPPATISVNASVNLNTYASTTSGLTLQYVSSTPGIASISSGSTLTGNSAGTVTVTVSQAGNTNYNAATDVQKQIEVVDTPIALAQWNFTGYGGPNQTAAVTLTAQTINSALNNGSAILTRGADAAQTNANDSFRTLGFKNDGIDVTKNDYFQTSFTAPDYILSLTSIKALVNGTASYVASPGVSSQFAYSFDNSTYTLINSPITSIGANQTINFNISNVPALQNIAANTTVYFRFYASGQTSTGGFGFYSPSSASSDNGLEFYGKVKPSSITWNGSEWSNYNGPDQYQDSVINGAYTETTGFTTKNLTVSNTGSLTIKANKDVVVTGNITLPADGKITIESDGNLVQKNAGADANSSQSITVERWAKLPKKGFTFWSAPVTGQNLYSFSNGGQTGGTPKNVFYIYNEANDYFVTKVTADGITLGDTSVFDTGRGYAIRGMDDFTPDGEADSFATAHKFSFAGKMNNGTVTSQTIKNSCGSSVTEANCAKGYNLIGNPYPSNLDFDKLYAANSTNIYGTAYFWTNNDITATGAQSGSSYSGNNHAVYNMSGGTPAVEVDPNPGDAVGAPNGIIKVGQGFIIKAKKVGNGQKVTFNNDMRVGYDEDALFYNYQNRKSEKNRFWLRLSTPNTISNTILIGYISGATNDYEINYDGELPVVGSDSFYSTLGVRKLAIQGRSDIFSTEDVVPLGNIYSANGNYTISLKDPEGIFNGGQKVYLRDKLLNKYIDLTTQNYEFSANKGTDETRFEIVYKDNATLTTGNVRTSDFVVYRDGDSFVVRSSKILGKVELYDAAGRILISKSVDAKEFRLNSSSVPSGVYVVRAANSGDQKTKKIIK